jgi:hypothetical protein
VSLKGGASVSTGDDEQDEKFGYELPKNKRLLAMFVRAPAVMIDSCETVSKKGTR